MTNELTDVRCSCGDEYPADSYDAGFIAGSGMCQNCDAALPPKDICTCPSGDGSLVHPCPAHPAVEQVGGDEREVDGKPRATKCPDCGKGDLMPGDLCACGYETDPAAGYACSECDGSGDGCVGEVCRECDGTGWFVTPEQARATLAQPSPASDLDPLNLAQHAEAFNEAPAEALKPEQAEAERPEVVGSAWRNIYNNGFDHVAPFPPAPGGPVVDEPLMTVAQHERITAQLHVALDESDGDRWKLRSERDAANARLHEVATACATAEQERDAALAEVERLHQFERICEGLPQDAIDGGWTVQGIRCYAKRLEDQLKVALARVAELERKLRDEENAHTTTIEQRDNAEHWADQLAKAIAERFGVDIGEHSNLNCPWNEALVWMQQPPAQAQHSVPEEFIGRLSEFLAQRGATGKALLRELRDMLAAAPGKEGV
ncbi:hypothetical protein AB7095_000576 [Pseudomonas aeruginosa]|uniref:hypothetical protein n=1 Tax=Pseudomonas aeruginosa TaxID=287 RepID=UPI000A4D8D66|nr:hypothetical protein [Pseudomonas aeruginosa]HEJ9470642.1 hypothetical protein [Pseudomonas aeruginosa]